LNCTQLLISDVRDDDVTVIGSGLLASNDQHDVDDDPWLHEQCSGLPIYSPAVSNIDSHIVATLDMAKRAVATEADHLGFECYKHDEFICGDAIEQGEKLARWLCKAPAGLHIWGGETTVTLPDKPGLGGRNQTLALAAAGVIEGEQDISILAAGTDGIDGNTPCAGAIVFGSTIQNARKTGFDVAEELKKANAGVVLMATGDLLKTGPSNTNVMDLIIAFKRK